MPPPPRCSVQAQISPAIVDLREARAYDQYQVAWCREMNGGLTDELDDDDTFKLAKYFLQVLAGVKNEDIVRDPDTARLTLGTAAVLQLVGGLVAFLLILGTIAYLRPDDALARLGCRATVVTLDPHRQTVCQPVQALGLDLVFEQGAQIGAFAPELSRLEGRRVEAQL